MRSPRRFLNTKSAPDRGSRFIARLIIPASELKLFRMSVSSVHRNILVLLVIPPVNQAQRQPAAIHAQSRRQVAPTEALSQVGDRPNDRNGYAGDARGRPAPAPGTGQIVDEIV